MKTEDISLFALNGRKDIFDRRIKEGYTEVALCSGGWIGNQRLAIVWVFYHPDGRLAVYERLKLKRINGSEIPVVGNEMECSEEEFRRYAEKYKIRIGAKTKLTDFFV